MADVVMDLTGLKCPQPVLKIQSKANSLEKGSVLSVKTDCPSFKQDVEKWASSTGSTVLECSKSDGRWSARIIV